MHTHRNTRISSLCMLIALPLSLAACQTRPVFADNSAVKSAAPPDNMALPARENDEFTLRRHVRVGHVLILELSSNPSTGFQWQLAKPLDGLMLEKISNDFKTDPNSKNKIGAGGTETWTFKALKTGITYIDMTYLRPWEPINATGQYTRYRIDIE